ncbi:MAG: hypothetical protein WAT79_12200 [Saprospiraceae bacterium]
MIKSLFIVFLLAVTQSYGQQIVLSEGGQKIQIQSDGLYIIMDENGKDISDPLQNNGIQKQIPLWLQHVKIIEAEYFVQIYLLQKEIDELKLELKQAKNENHKTLISDCKNKIKELKGKLKDTIDLYNNALSYKKLADSQWEDGDKASSKKILKIQEYIDSKDYLFKTIKYRKGQPILLTNDHVNIENTTSENKDVKNQNSVVIDTFRIDQTDCFVKKMVEDNVTIEFLQFQSIFQFTPERLKVHLKNENLLEGKVRLRTTESNLFMDLQLEIRSKDAAKSYGFIPEGNLLRLEFVNGIRLNLKAKEQVLGRIEEYSGRVLFQASFLLDKEMTNQLEKLPIDYIGVMWSSGFEKYEVYEVDVLMNQIKCVH